MDILVKWCVYSCLLASAISTGAVAESLNDTEIKRDPWEPANRAVFNFNDKVDGYFLKPVSIGYQAIAPDPLEAGVTNFFANLGEVSNIVNNVLQWKWKKVSVSTGRLLLNSTIGLAGFVDVAGAAGLRRQENESFGQTLSYWGVPAGPYLVLPFLGPSTVTDTVGVPVEQFLDPTHYSGDNTSRIAFKVVEAIDLRARLLKSEAFISGDRYGFIRDAYLQRREYLLHDGQVKDDFGSDLDEFDGDF